MIGLHNMKKQEKLRKVREPDKNNMRNCNCCVAVVWCRHILSFDQPSLKVNTSAAPCVHRVHAACAALSNLAMSVFNHAVHMQLICNAVKCGEEMLMSLLRLPVVVLGLSVCEFGEKRCAVWAAAVAVVGVAVSYGCLLAPLVSEQKPV